MTRTGSNQSTLDDDTAADCSNVNSAGRPPGQSQFKRAPRGLELHERREASPRASSDRRLVPTVPKAWSGARDDHHEYRRTRAVVRARAYLALDVRVGLPDHLIAAVLEEPPGGFPTTGVDVPVGVGSGPPLLALELSDGGLRAVEVVAGDR